MDATNLFGHSMIQPLPYDENDMWHGHPHLCMNTLEETLNTPDDSDFGYFVGVELKYPDNKKERTKKFPFAPENNVIPKDKYNEYLKKIKPKNYTKAREVICDWSYKKNYFIHYRMLKYLVRHGMVVDKNHEKFFPSNKVSGWKNIYYSRHKNEIRL